MDNTKRISAISPFACLSGMVDDDLFYAKKVNKVSYFSWGVEIYYSLIKIVTTIFLPLSDMKAVYSSVSL